MAKEWFIFKDGKQYGPMAPEELRRKAASGELQPADRVRPGDRQGWFMASAVKGLFTSKAGESPPPRPPSANDSGSEGTPKWLWGLLGTAVLLLCGLGIHAVWWSKHKAEQTRIEIANRDVREAVEKAQDWIRAGQLSDADQVEQSLKAAEANSVATDKGSVGPNFTAFQAAKSERQAADRKLKGEQQAADRKLKGEQQAAGILQLALDAITEKQFDRAQTFLRQYVGHPYAKQRQRAETLLAEIPLATSDANALQTLLAMDGKSFTSFSQGDVPMVALSHPALIETRIATLKKNLAEAARQREEARKRAEAERIAEQDRIDAEREANQRRAELERRAAQVKWNDEDRQRRVRMSELAGATLLDIADDPKKYVGMTYTFLVWIPGSSVSPTKEKNDEDQVVVDGYVFEFAPGERDPTKADKVGNRFEVIADKLNPFIASKEAARALQDLLDPNQYRKLKVTFTVRAVVLREYKSPGKESIGYLADISKIELP